MHIPSVTMEFLFSGQLNANSNSESESGDNKQYDQLLSQDSEHLSCLSTEDTSASFPSVVRFQLESPSIDVHNGDMQTINSILGNITDPITRSALESITRDPGHICQCCNHIRPASRCSPEREWAPLDLLYDGLVFAGFDIKRLQKNNIARKTEWFKAFYGVEHTTVAPYLIDLRKDNPDVNAKDCLMAMNWLKGYDTYPVLSARWESCEEYIGPKVIEHGFKMAKLARKKIVFALEHDVEIGRSVDCVTFMTREMRLDPSSEWFDWKTHSCGLVSSIIFGYFIIYMRTIR